MSEYPQSMWPSIVIVHQSPCQLHPPLPPSPWPSCEKYKDVSPAEINDGGAPVPAPGLPLHYVY